MKKLIIRWIEWYQRISRHKSPTCRYKPTCSHYAKEAFETRNFFYAALLSIWRILRCNPFSKGGYDPVPKPKVKKRKDDR
ncbi:MAG: membrane protein insertion efficiency factor YidD [Candidatus Izemoplasmataceae bacterium]